MPLTGYYKGMKTAVVDWSLSLCHSERSEESTLSEHGRYRDRTLSHHPDPLLPMGDGIAVNVDGPRGLG